MAAILWIAVACAGWSSASAQAPPRENPGEYVPPPLSIRIAGGVTQPFGELANEEPGQGWVGGQGLGFSLQAGVRFPLMRDLQVRPEISFYRFDRFRDPELDALVFDGTGAPPDTVQADFRRSTLMSGLRVHLDYIPHDRGFASPFLTGGLGLVYMRFEDDVELPGVGDVSFEDSTLGLSATAGVGLLVGRAEALLAATFQEPGFEDAGSVSWFTIDLTLGVSLPIPR